MLSWLPLCHGHSHENLRSSLHHGLAVAITNVFVLESDFKQAIWGGFDFSSAGTDVMRRKSEHPKAPAHRLCVQVTHDLDGLKS